MVRWSPVFSEVGDTGHNGGDVHQSNTKPSQDRIEENEKRNVSDITG